MPLPIIPKALKPDDKIALISPSTRINAILPPAIQQAITVLESHGYKVQELYIPDTDAESSISNRLTELRKALTDSSISAVISTIGGMTFNQLLPDLLANTALHAAVRANPKPVVGMSDITELHWFLYATSGLRSFYGPNAIPKLCEPGPSTAFNIAHLLRVLTVPGAAVGDIPRSPFYAPDRSAVFAGDLGREPRLLRNPGWIWIRGGRARGRLFGGVLSAMPRLCENAALAPDWRGRIVFFETVQGEDRVAGDPLSNVRGFLERLIALGVFEHAAGVVIGRAFGYDTDELRVAFVDLIREVLCAETVIEKEREFPILFGVDFGHTSPMVTLPLDALAMLDSEENRFSVLEAGVTM